MSELIRLAEYWEGFFDEYGPSENDHSAEAGAYRLAKAHLEALDKLEAAEKQLAEYERYDGCLYCKTKDLEQQLAEAKADAESWSAQSDKDVSMLNKEIEKNKRLREAIIKLEKASVHGMFGCDADDTNPFEKALYDLFDMIQAHKEEK